MTEYLKENPDTTTEEFDEVWHKLDAEIKGGRTKKSKDAKAAASSAA